MTQFAEDASDEAPDAIVDDELRAQAARLETVMPSIARRLFAVAPSHPLVDMPVAQLRLCVLLLSHESPTMSQIAEEFRISVSAVTQLADRLERAGMVERVSAETVAPGATERDRRARHLRLTAHGRDLMLSRRESRQCGARAALSHISPEDRQRILDALEILLAASQRIPGDGARLPTAEAPEDIAHLEWTAGAPATEGSVGEASGGTDPT